MDMKRILIGLAAVMLCGPGLSAQTPPPKPDSVATIQGLTATADRTEVARVPALQSLTLPATQMITAARVEQTVNIIDTEDAVKYFPSVFLRKRNSGDTQATLGTRVWGTSSGARSLIFADGIPLSALIANNNTTGVPKWGLVAPIEVARIDMMYGPFSAAYAGNSIGAVMEITTRMPEKFEATISQSLASQAFDLYGTTDRYGTRQTSADVGNRMGKLSFWVSGNYQKSASQPLAFVTGGTNPNGATGAYDEQNKIGATANVFGAVGLTHTGMTNAKAKLAYDITPAVRASYTFGYWASDIDADAATYLIRNEAPTFAGQPGFALGTSRWDQKHSSHSLAVRSNRKGDWDFDAVVSTYRFDRDRQHFPASAAANDTTFSAGGRISVLDGTGWTQVDLRGAWHKGGPGAPHVVTFGVHQDRYTLKNPTHGVADWRADGPYTATVSEGSGSTRTQALWAQDAWAIAPAFKLTVGGRYEQARGYDGRNANGSTAVDQPEVNFTRFSPKAVLQWAAQPTTTITASVAKAYRFATASELYQLVTTGTTFTSPDPNLKPDDVLAAELRAVRLYANGSVQLALFQDDVHDAIISQFQPLVAGSPTLYSFPSNVDHVRARGVELAFGETDMFVRGLELSGSATYLNARTLALSGRASATAPEGTAIGKRLPNIPVWRASFITSYRPNARWTVALAGRYSGKLYTTLDNADTHPNTYQGFSEWFVADAKANYRHDAHWSASLGADNLLNRKYFLFHPFPQRTFVGNLKYTY
jgi:iron complex outermembrane receptor protein